jgi:hypothetical protein
LDWINICCYEEFKDVFFIDDVLDALFDCTVDFGANDDIKSRLLPTGDSTAIVIK